MGSTSFDERNSVRVITPRKMYVPKTTRLRLLKDVLLTSTGKITGKQYYFAGAGSEVDVDSKDAIELLKRKGNTSCCGSISSNYFEIVI